MKLQNIILATTIAITSVAAQGAAFITNSGETLTLTSAIGTTILTFAYGTTAPWPAADDISLHYATGAPGSASSWFGFPATPGANPPDADGDGMSNAAESTAGTNPGDPASVLRIVSIVRQLDGSYVGTFSSIPGRAYSVFSSPDFATWTKLPPDLTATGATQTFTDPNPTGTRRFYKVVTPTQP